MGRKKKVKPAAEETCEDVGSAPTSSVAAIEAPPVGAIVITERGTVATPVAPRAISVPYSSELAENVYELYISGMSLHKIAGIDGMPSYGSLLRWLRDNADFRNMIEQGRQLRAIHHEEQALKSAEDTFDKEDVPAARLKFDAHVWAAGVNDPARFGKKTTVSGDPDRPLVFQISTGVPEPDDKRTIVLNADGTVKKDDDATTEALP